MIFAGLDQRLAGFLLEKYEESGSPEIVMTQEEIAGEINSARSGESVVSALVYVCILGIADYMSTVENER